MNGSGTLFRFELTPAYLALVGFFVDRSVRVTRGAAEQNLNGA
jgi:hypothetical protein